MALLTRAGLALGATALLAAALAAVAAGCFSPRQPGCAFSCNAPPHACPTNYSCGDDGFCHRNDGAGECLLSSDAGPGDDASDAATTD